MKLIKLFNLQNGHYYAIVEPYNFIREGVDWFFIGLDGRIPLKKWSGENDIGIEAVYSEECFK